MAIMKNLLTALCALSGVQAALNMDLRIGSGGRTIHDFKKEVRLSFCYFNTMLSVELH